MNFKIVNFINYFISYYYLLIYVLIIFYLLIQHLQNRPDYSKILIV